MSYSVVMVYDEDGSEGWDAKEFKTRKQAEARMKEIRLEHEEHGESAELKVVNTEKHFGGQTLIKIDWKERYQSILKKEREGAGE